MSGRRGSTWHNDWGSGNGRSGLEIRNSNCPRYVWEAPPDGQGHFTTQKSRGRVYWVSKRLEAAPTIGWQLPRPRYLKCSICVPREQFFKRALPNDFTSSKSTISKPYLRMWQHWRLQNLSVKNFFMHAFHTFVFYLHPWLDAFHF